MKANKSPSTHSRRAESPISTRQPSLSQNIGNPEGSKVLALIVAIRSNLVEENKHELIKSLNELSVFFRPQEHEKTIEQHNGRILTLLGWLRNRSQHDWDKPIKITGILRNSKQEFVESQDKDMVPSVDLVMKEPISHNGSIGGIRTETSTKRELMLLKIYGISIERINTILRQH